MYLLRTHLSRALANAPRRHYSTSTPPPKLSLQKNLTAIAFGTSLAGFTFYFLRKDQPQPGADVLPQRPNQENSPLDPKEFVNLKLKKIIPYNHNSSTFVFELPEGQASLLPVASCVVVKAAEPDALVDDKGKPIIRPYTPTSHPYLPGEMHFLIKRYETGNASKYIHSLKEGNTLAIKGPIPKFPFKVNEFDEVALIGGGSGITPLYQILQYALPDPNNKTKFKLIYANVTEKDILLREQFERWKKQYPDKFDLVYVVEQGNTSWNGELGYVTKEMVQKYVSPASLGNKVKVFVCGPPPQVAAVAGSKAGMQQGEIGGILKELGYNSDQVFKF